MQVRIFILCFSFLVQVIMAQDIPNVKGATPISVINNHLTAKNTYAVVVGISDYQDPDISDLRFADKDAIAFSNYLRSRAGGSLDGDHLKLLVDSAATMAAFAGALDWLKSIAKEGDRAIIYFSGHGDMETKINDELGYLLCYDAGSRVYAASGAFPLYTLQKIVSSLTTENGAKVIIIADACHSGALAGNSIGGQHITTANLKAFDNDIKILSCQPFEFSIEGEQWGGGRGAFSYHLIDALYGMANQNDDEWVTLQEAGRYLEDHVSKDVAPIKQVPIISGERFERLAEVDTFLLNAIKNGKTNQGAMLASIESRSEEKITANADTGVQRIYKLFKKTLKDKIFLYPSNQSDTGYAEMYYQQLIKVPQLAPIYGTMRRNYATALQDDAQQVLNGLLKVDVNEITMSKVSKSKKYKNYPSYLNRAAELLGNEHFFYNKLKARQCFFEGLLLYWDNSGNKNIDEGVRIMNKFRESISYEPNSPQTYFYMMYCQVYKFENKDSTILFGIKAANLSPAWVLPYAYLSYFSSFKFKDSINSKEYLRKAILIDSQNIMVINTKASWNYYNGNFQEANKLYQIVAKRDSNSAISRLNLGVVNLKLKQYELAKEYLIQYIKLDSAGVLGYHYMAIAWEKLNNEAEAETNFIKAIKLYPNYTKSIRELAKLYRKQKRNEEAELLFRKLLTFDSDMKPEVYYELACLMALKNQVAESLDFLEKALSGGFKKFDEIKNNPELVNLSNEVSFEKMLLKYN